MAYPLSYCLSDSAHRRRSPAYKQGDTLVWCLSICLSVSSRALRSCTFRKLYQPPLPVRSPAWPVGPSLGFLDMLYRAWTSSHWRCSQDRHHLGITLCLRLSIGLLTTNQHGITVTRECYELGCSDPACRVRICWLLQPTLLCGRPASVPSYNGVKSVGNLHQQAPGSI